MGQNLKKKLLNKFNTFRVHDFKQVYVAVTESILNLLSVGFIERKEKNDWAWRIREFLQVFDFSITHLVRLNSGAIRILILTHST